MGFKSTTLLLFPVAVMIIAILLESGSSPALAGSGPVSFCNPNDVPQQANCLPPNSVGTSYYCEASNILGTLGYCKILPSCTIAPPGPAYCVNDPLSAAVVAIATGNVGCLTNFASCGVFLPAGSYVFIPTSVLASDLSSAAGFFGFTVGASGYIAMIGIVVGLISLAGFTVFGSGIQSESVHVLFMGGMLMGFWLILTGLEGFLGGSTTSVFVQLNDALAGTGSFLYVLFTLMYTFGFVGAVSRGGV